MKVNIKAVAEEVGMSITTVSKALNGYTDISDATKKKVFQAARKLNYYPNRAAKELSSKNKNKVGLLFNETNFNRKSTLVLEIISGVYEFFKEKDADFIQLFIDESKKNSKSFKQLCYEQNLDGVIIHGLNVDDEYVKEIVDSNFPTVFIDMRVQGHNIGNVSINNIKAAQEAVEYLIKLGHKDIVMINGFKNSQVSIDRLLGYKQALKLNSIDIKADYIVNANFSEEEAYNVTGEIIKKNPTAFFCASDLMAIGVQNYLLDHGFSVPEDYSIVGFDNIILTEFTNPKITTMSQNIKDISIRSAEMLWEHLNSPSELLHDDFVPHKLIIRNSSKKLMIYKGGRL